MQGGLVRRAGARARAAAQRQGKQKQKRDPTTQSDQKATQNTLPNPPNPRPKPCTNWAPRSSTGQASKQAGRKQKTPSQSEKHKIHIFKKQNGKPKGTEIKVWKRQIQPIGAWQKAGKAQTPNFGGLERGLGRAQGRPGQGRRKLKTNAKPRNPNPTQLL